MLMRLVTYKSPNGPRIAGVLNGRYVDLNQADSSLPTSMTELLALGERGLAKAAMAISAGKPFDPTGIKILAPVPTPQKVICIGLNYADHAAESGVEPPSEPVVFNKFLNAVAAHDDEIVLPRNSSQVDYEAELVVVIGTGGRHIPRNKAFHHVAGYACGHDVSARDWQLQKPGKQWLLGKTFDGFAPFGPELVTSDEIPEPGDLEIRLRLNGEMMQNSNTRQLIFPIDELISYLSSVCTLVPGDVIFTGTPPGVGMARKPPVFLKPGDTTEVEIEGIGVLKNTFVAE
jgi:2-keto-4-pentenoate hydratase/2-oxohepta-3-ene-1,7-dioic acid hydratase in catechol pathway